ncbi:MAG: hypothetical protein KGH69_01370 [Candidatus Micrarchaeota archaeon]|nr:hypothetical protein [Candidatus Micrarchaeota archaeon]
MADIHTMCHICGRKAERICALCGRGACKEHIDEKSGACIACRRGKR